ncbi:MAG: tyrosine-type recombinase/integrase [Bacteroidaceae bacterium]
MHYENKPTGEAYTERGHSVDRAVIHKVRDRVGFNFKNHTLRRTFGRNLYHAGIPIETIAALYGHNNIKTTLEYIGINLEDMDDALAKLYKHQLAMSEKRKRGD